MIGLKTWTARSGNKVIIVTAECAEVARQIVQDRHGIELANVDLTRSRGSRVIESDNAAIVAELERLERYWRERTAEDAKRGLIASQAFCSGLAGGLEIAIEVVQAGGALPPESLSDESN